MSNLLEKLGEQAFRRLPDAKAAEVLGGMAVARSVYPTFIGYTYIGSGEPVTDYAADGDGETAPATPAGTAL